MPIRSKLGGTKDRPKVALVTRSLGLSDPLTEAKERHLPQYKPSLQQSKFHITEVWSWWQR